MQRRNTTRTLRESLMIRLGILYPPAGAEFEYYLHGERLDEVRVAVLGVRIFGDDDEHAPRHLRRTAAISNLETSARALKPLAPAAAIWACTSGSFIDGLAHARHQADALATALGCPATSTALAFPAALIQLGINRVSVLASYPQDTSAAFVRFLEEAGLRVDELRCLSVPSGPAAAQLDQATFFEAATAMTLEPGAALLIPDTAVPTLAWVEALEQRIGRTVLTANQVSLWRTVQLTGRPARLPGLGRLWRASD